MPKPTNMRLWNAARRDAYKERGLWRGSLEKSAPGWDARLAQRAVRIYKDRGGKYEGGARGDASLTKWSREKWSHVLGDPEGRYLPEKVQERMPTKLKKAENKRKRECTRKGQKRCPYLPGTLALMKHT